MRGDLFLNLRDKSIIQYFGEEEEVDVVSMIEEVVTDLRVVRLGPFSFAYNSILKSICIPSSVEIVCEGCFCFCETLSSVMFEIGCKISVIEEGAFGYCDSITSICIPATVKTLGASCFSNCRSLSSFTFESGTQVVSIGDHSFLGCESLTSIRIPASVEAIGKELFQSCEKLPEVTFEAGSNYLAHDNPFEAA
jgi:hypothetical protein